MAKEKTDPGKIEKVIIESSRKIEEEQILLNELKKNLKDEIVSEGFVLLAIYLFFIDCDF